MRLFLPLLSKGSQPPHRAHLPLRLHIFVIELLQRQRPLVGVENLVVVVSSYLDGVTLAEESAFDHMQAHEALLALGR